MLELLTQRRGVIAGKWLDQIIASYPADTVNFLKKKHDRFANPVGTTLARGTAAVVEALFDGAKADVLHNALEPIVRIRAVQDFSPSAAVSFVFKLKDVIRDLIGDAAGDRGTLRELHKLDNRIDELALLAFDIFARCREQVAEIRVSEIKRNVAHVLRRSDWFDGGPPLEADRPSTASCRGPQQGGD